MPVIGTNPVEFSTSVDKKISGISRKCEHHYTSEHIRDAAEQWEKPYIVGSGTKTWPPCIGATGRKIRKERDNSENL